MTPKVSVLMPAYNAERYIEEAIQSILEQTMQDFELIIVDDGSSDGTWNIVQKHASRDARIRAYKNDCNLGVSKTRNKLLALAEGAYVAWQDADDISSIDRLKKQRDFMEAHPEVGICGGFLEFFYPDGRSFVRSYAPNDAHLRKTIFRFSPVSQGVAMIRREEILRIGGFNERLSQAEDLDLSFRIGTVAQFANLQEVLLRYRQHASISRKGLKQNIRTTLKVRRWAYNLGYQVGLVDILVNIATAMCCLLPAAWIEGLFRWYRDRSSANV